MPRAKPQTWTAAPRRRRWGCLIVALLLAFVAAVVLLTLVWFLRPRAPIDAMRLVGEDTDGLVLIDLNRDSANADLLVKELVRPLARDVDSSPEELHRQVTQILDVLTFRQAVGLLRYDPRTEFEAWAWVVGLKRLGEPIRLLVKNLAEKEGRSVRTETRAGTVYFWYDEGGPFFAVDPRALVLANDKEWLERVLARVKRPRRATDRAEALSDALPAATTDTIVRASMLFTPERWAVWKKIVNRPDANLQALADAHAFLDEIGIKPPDLNTLACGVTAAEAGRLRLVFLAHCDATTAPLEAARRVRNSWSNLAALLSGAYMPGTAHVTSETVTIGFGYMTEPIDKLLAEPPGPAATSTPTTTPATSNVAPAVSR